MDDQAEPPPARGPEEGEADIGHDGRRPGEWVETDAAAAGDEDGPREEMIEVDDQAGEEEKKHAAPAAPARARGERHERRHEDV